MTERRGDLGAGRVGLDRAAEQRQRLIRAGGQPQGDTKIVQRRSMIRPQRQRGAEGGDCRVEFAHRAARLAFYRPGAGVARVAPQQRGKGRGRIRCIVCGKQRDCQVHPCFVIRRCEPQRRAIGLDCPAAVAQIDQAVAQIVVHMRLCRRDRERAVEEGHRFGVPPGFTSDHAEQLQRVGIFGSEIEHAQQNRLCRARAPATRECHRMVQRIAERLRAEARLPVRPRCRVWSWSCLLHQHDIPGCAVKAACLAEMLQTPLVSSR